MEICFFPMLLPQVDERLHQLCQVHHPLGGLERRGRGGGKEVIMGPLDGKPGCPISLGEIELTFYFL